METSKGAARARGERWRWGQGLVSFVVVLAAGCHYSFDVTGPTVECGDGVCSPGLETAADCEQDCGWVDVSGGVSFTCGVKRDGTAWCWGLNDTGQLGDGTQEDRTVPTRVSDLSGITSVAAGTRHACALSGEDGSLWCWGDNVFGELGDGTVETSSVPQRIEGLPPVEQVAAGQFVTCAVDVNQDLWCWGSNGFGELGLGYVSDATAPVTVPTRVESLSSVVFVSVSRGYSNVCAVVYGGTVWCWGQGESGQLGNGTTPAYSATPVQVLRDDITAEQLEAAVVSVGSSFACASTDLVGPSLYCWGANGSGVLGTGTTDATTARASVISEPEDVDVVSAGIAHACARRLNGQVVCWGSNTLGQLGLGSADPTSSDRPVDVVELDEVVQLSVGGLHTCVRTGSGQLECWGDNSTGALGDGTTIYRYVPTAVLDP